MKMELHSNGTRIPDDLAPAIPSQLYCHLNIFVNQDFRFTKRTKSSIPPATQALGFLLRAKSAASNYILQTPIKAEETIRNNKRQQVLETQLTIEKTAPCAITPMH